MTSVPDVFIVETLDPDDEGNGRFEGSNVSHVLLLHGKHPMYRYVRTRAQFRGAIREFARSDYRYLHISAHADRNGISTTNLDQISNADLAEYLNPALRGKRLFMSACSAVHEGMAGLLFPTTGCISIVGPRTDVRFTEAAVFWPAVYHLIFTQDSERVTRAALKDALQKVSGLFEIEIAFFAKSKTLKQGYSADILKPLKARSAK